MVELWWIIVAHYSVSEIKSINNIESERVKLGWTETSKMYGWTMLNYLLLHTIVHGLWNCFFKIWFMLKIYMNSHIYEMQNIERKITHDTRKYIHGDYTKCDNTIFLYIYNSIPKLNLK